ncbi:hypothetical protein BY996DRAFT_6421024 [Phakopsora pachyrhizi]|uniref:Expressed protein n=1 Tax=Phakopsora pachyrhizi TaxID=170000 RepID=A0AAV0ARU4_PHAPC|nr:hypothetical protein BY996DRAFT_6421024 [Phakopsora pachyrhizi]CAH7670396.1 expressed protein [Phakopsora pachyrhizi]
MPSSGTAQRGFKIFRSIKRRLSTLNIGNQANSQQLSENGLVSKLKCNFSSTPDLRELNPETSALNSFITSPVSSSALCRGYGEQASDESYEQSASGSDLYSSSVDSPSSASSFTSSVSSSTSSQKILKSTPNSGSPKATICSGFSAERQSPQTIVLFEPPKSLPGHRYNSRARLPFQINNFVVKRRKSTLELSTRENNRQSYLPTITLTLPEDDNLYYLTRPCPLIPKSTHLQIPAQAPSAKFRDLAPKRWPHPAGPWLRPEIDRGPNHSTIQFEAFAPGSRLADGSVIGWEPDDFEAMGVYMPPKLLSEQDRQTIALVEQIATSLDEAQEALYQCWKDEEEEEYWEGAGLEEENNLCEQEELSALIDKSSLTPGVPICLPKKSTLPNSLELPNSRDFDCEQTWIEKGS